MTSPSHTVIPTAALVQLTHGVAQALADEHGVDLLHVKGPAADPTLRRPRDSFDADVLVRPEHLTTFLAALKKTGWTKRSGFAEGSAFGHAANWFHPGLGYLDVHRSWPGPRRDPSDIFQLWWESRGAVWLAHRSCPVPSVEDQRLILLLHVARDRGRRTRELATLWTPISLADKDMVRSQAASIGAEVGLAAAIGELDRHRGAPDHRLWLAHAEADADRVDDWWGRWRAADGWQAKASIVFRSLAVNTAHLEFRLGRPPRRTEIVAEWCRRWARLLADLRHRLRGDRS